MNKDFSGGYYEAIMQLRPADDRILDYIFKEIENRNNVFISKRVDIKTGIDLYITSYRFAVSLARNMKKKFGGTIKISKQLYSQHRLTSKLIYRVTILYKPKSNVYK